jgi:HEAT repeat protein
MGLFDFLKGGKGERSGSKGEPTSSALRKHAARVANKRAQAPDRWDSIQALAQMGTPEAIEALLARFSFQTDPSITDQEEKDAAFEAVVETGATAVEPVKHFLRTAETIAWPLRMLDRLLEPEEVLTELLGSLAVMHLEYERDPERKLSLLSTLEERRDPRVIEAAARFLEDVNETARFYAAGAIYAQENADAVRPLLLAALAKEDSVRTRARILEGFAARGWDVGEHREKLSKQLPPGFSLDAKGIVQKK